VTPAALILSSILCHEPETTPTLIDLAVYLQQLAGYWTIYSPTSRDGRVLVSQYLVLQSHLQLSDFTAKGKRITSPVRLRAAGACHNLRRTCAALQPHWLSLAHPSACADEWHRVQLTILRRGPLKRPEDRSKGGPYKLYRTSQDSSRTSSTLFSLVRAIFVLLFESKKSPYFIRLHVTQQRRLQRGPPP